MKRYRHEREDGKHVVRDSKEARTVAVCGSLDDALCIIDLFNADDARRAELARVREFCGLSEGSA